MDLRSICIIKGPFETRRLRVLNGGRGGACSSSSIMGSSSFEGSDSSLGSSSSSTLSLNGSKYPSSRGIGLTSVGSSEK